jgi:HAMP domain-containing protein
VIRRAVLAVWDFVVGDDWRLALAAVAAIGLTAIVCALGLNVWWLAPLIALGALRWTLRSGASGSHF